MRPGSTMNRGVFLYAFLREGGHMEVQGERYFLIMLYMHFLCFLAAGRMLGLPLKGRRILPACLFSSLYSLLALWPGPALQNGLFTGLALVLSAWMAFGRQGPAACLPLGLGGLCCGGLCAYLTKRGLSLLPCLGLCTLLCLMLHPKKAVLRAALEITNQGRRCRLPALYDTGNTLHYAPLSLPVIVCSEAQLSPLLPRGLSAAALHALPKGFFLLPASTVHGRKLLMAFHPEKILLLPEKRRVDALIALTPEPLPHALLPRTIPPKEVSKWRKKVCPGKAFPPSVNG